MDQDPEMQGNNTSKPQATNASTLDNHATQTTTVVETVTEETTSSKATVPDGRPMATEVITETTTETIGQPTAPQKKSHKGLIGLIIALIIVILVAIGGVVWYFMYYNNPNKVAYDAIRGFLQQETVVTEGLITGRGKIGDSEVLFTIGTNGKSKGTLAGESNVLLKLSILDANGEPVNDRQYEVELGGIIMTDGVMYLRTGKLMESIDLLLEDMSTTRDELDETYQAVYTILDNVDGEWWQISVPDIIDGVIDDSHIASSSKEFYGCLVNVAQEDVKGQIASLYSSNQFVGIKKSNEQSTPGSTIYDVDLDYDKMADFMNATLETDAAKSAENCLRKFVVDDLGGNINAITKTTTNAEELKNALGDVKFSMTISNFRHELQQLDASTKQDDGEVTAGFGFTHPDVTINAPENYRPINDLIEMIIEAIAELNGVDAPDDLVYDDITNEWDFIDDENVNDIENM